MTGSVYVETSIISYLTARPSRDIVIAAHQLPLDLELQAHRERGDAWYDRGDLSLRGLGAAHHLHPRGATVRELSMKRRDPIIDGLHRIREAIGKAHDFDVRRIAATIRRHEEASGTRVVHQMPKRTTHQKRAS